jgi:biotin carboxylase
MPRILLLLPAAGYRNEDFLTAAFEMGMDVVSAADHCHQLAPLMGMSPILSLPFDKPELAAEQALVSLGRQIDVVLAVDDHGLELAALLNEKLGLTGNSFAAVRTTRDKLAFRQLQKSYGFNCPRFHAALNEADALALAPSLPYPVVVKARRLSASRGVIRANDADAYRDAEELGIIVESFIPGREHALEGLLQKGLLRVMALFDKPDPLDGPYFEETIYVTPSRLPADTQAAIAADVQRACSLAGLTHGPVHAEMRVNDQGVWLLEVAARSIGGLCARVLRNRLGMPLEEMILRNALDMPLPISPDNRASGVMMIPIPEQGIFQGVTGVAEARAVDGISDIRITAQPGQIVAPPPEGSGYLGFIFAHALTPEAAEVALRAAHVMLGFDIRPEVPIARAQAQ